MTLMPTPEPDEFQLVTSRFRPASGARPKRMGKAARRGLQFGGLLGLALLSACATSQGPQVSATKEAAQYAARAAKNYDPPGPPSDPWGPYVSEASKRFDVPERWVRQVMRVESGGNVFLNGAPIVSPVGAMGLMQVMPDTFDELRAKYGFGEDPFDPHNSILAGTAYIREMYDLYGSPGFLAAYNAGPGRLDDYLVRNKPLPEETRRYVAMIGPNIAGISPSNRSMADQYAANAVPLTGPAPRSAPVQLASAAPLDQPGRSVPYADSVQSASLPPPAPAPVAPAAPQLAAYEPPAQRRNGFRVFGTAMADTLPTTRHAPATTTGNWAVQVGAFGNEAQARTALTTARSLAGAEAEGARSAVIPVAVSRNTLFRARLTGMSRETAIQACERIGHKGNCMVLSPDAQS